MRNRLIAGSTLLITLAAIGTVSYMLLEEWSFLDALYMVVITITTVGYREVHTLSVAGTVLTMVLALAGVGTLFYVATSVIQMAIEGDIKNALGTRRMHNRIEHLQDHYLLCGFGRVGSEIAKIFAERQAPFVVIETDPERLQLATSLGYLVIEGDATRNDILDEAGIDRAKGLVAASDSDANNTYITLGAKAQNPNVLIIARAGRSETGDRLIHAGADRVISPYLLAGRRMAFSALQPSMVDFMDTAGDQSQNSDAILAEMSIQPDSPFLHKTLSEMFEGAKSARVLGIQQRDGNLLLAPSMDSILREGDRVIVMGREAELEGLEGTALKRTQPSHQLPRQ